MKTTMRRLPMALLIAAALLLPAALSFAQGAQGSQSATTGVLVAGVDTGGPADKAGIARGDIILQVNGKAVNTPRELAQTVRSMKVGDAVSLAFRHGDVQKTANLTVAQANGTPWIGLIIERGGGGFYGMGPGMGHGFSGPDMPYGMPFEASGGAYVASVVSGSPADKAGLKAGDLILSIDGTALDAQHNLVDLIGAKKIGDTVTLSVQSVSTGQAQPARDVKVTLDKNPQATDKPFLGVQYTQVPQRFGQLGPGQTPGVLVAQVQAGSPAEKAGIQPGDVITRLDGAAVQTPQQVSDAVGKHKPGDTVTVSVYRQANGKSSDLTVSLAQNASDKTKAFLGIAMGDYRGLGMGMMPFNPGTQGQPAPTSPQQPTPYGQGI